MASANVLMFPLAPASVRASEESQVTGSEPPRLLIVDDHALPREVLAEWLRARGMVVRTTPGDAADLAAVTQDPAPELGLVVARTPGTAALADRLHASFPGIAIALLTEVSGPGPARADAVLDMGARPAELLRALFALAGRSPADRVPLTPRECDVLRGVSAGLSNKEIARALDLQEVTVKLHMQRLSRKLKARNRTHAALLGRDLGLV